ncbi:sensor histidine kinase [Cryptosporangium arvum]|uniref:histidine kinase n=1 Tax=Cryptosporangium arvum DSM 44712 TaxID=927661 RepID=A0A010YK26_9ACTN|nr:histidine kinase [Cryptosporangium arvum]EXG80595.1 signal transduction histidine kinase [Cryptosporangium arvum DSM 44712]
MEAFRRHRASMVDALLALICAVTLVPATDSTLFGGSPYGIDAVPPVLVALGVGAAALVRRRYPLVLAAVALVGWVLAAAYPVVVLAQYTLGAHERSRRVVVAATAVVTVAVAVPFRRQGLDAVLPLSVAVCVAPAVLGLWLASRRAVLAGLRHRAERAEHEQRLVEARARADERARIAHDMHDVVTHRVSLMVLHATAAAVAGEPEKDRLVERIRLIGREALEELRTLVVVLHDDEEAPRAPQPRLADVEELAREAGVRYRVTGEPGSLSVLVEQTAYRVVQEALTNVRKHAPGAAAEVLIAHGDVLGVVVMNGPAARHPEPLPGGNGLLGLRERVRISGGWFHAGPSAGGFRVTALLPVDA